MLGSALPEFVLNPDQPLPYYSNALMLREVPENAEFGQSMRNKERHRFVHPTSALKVVETLGMGKAGQLFNTNEIKAAFVGKVEKSIKTGEPLNLVSLVCPPYTYTSLASREANGLAHDFEPDPLTYNFAINFKAVMFDLAYLARTLKGFGANVNPTFVVGDWAFRGADRIAAKMGGAAGMMEAMGEFSESAAQHADHFYSDTGLQIDRFSHSHLPQMLPFGMPLQPGEKEAFMQQVLKERTHGVIPADTRTMFEFASGMFSRYGNQLVQLVNPKTWPNLEASMPDLFEEMAAAGIGKAKAKHFLVDFLKLFRNTVASRAKEMDQVGEGEPDRAGFYDALMKSYEYILYGSEYAARFPNAVNYNWDLKYPAAGLFYGQGDLDTVFLDPRKFPTPMAQLGISVIPF